MTYITVKKVIENKKNALLEDDDWNVFVIETTSKLDVFLLNNRITKEQYNELINLLKKN